MNDFRGNWDEHLPLIEFSYNNSYHFSIGMTQFEELYGKRCLSPIGLFEVEDSSTFGLDIIHEALGNVGVIRHRFGYCL